MSVTQKEEEVSHREWGDGTVVIHEGSKTGAWVQYDPDDPMLDLENWR